MYVLWFSLIYFYNLRSVSITVWVNFTQFILLYTVISFYLYQPSITYVQSEQLSWISACSMLLINTRTPGKVHSSFDGGNVMQLNWSYQEKIIGQNNMISFFQIHFVQRSFNNQYIQYVFVWMLRSVKKSLHNQI